MLLTQQIYVSFCLTHFLLTVPEKRKENEPHITPVTWYSTIQGCISQMKEVYTKADIHKYTAHLLSEGSAHCKKDTGFLYLCRTAICWTIYSISIRSTL